MNHVPVLLNECLEGLNINPDGIYVDGTLGRGGHSEAIASRLSSGHLICIDRDETAINEAGERLKEFGSKVTLIRGNFNEVSKIIRTLGIAGVDGMLFDLGVSSPQLDDASRGFSYNNNAPLDMRMDQSSGLSAFDVVNYWKYEELKRILYEYGEERYAPKIASEIIKKREIKPITTTFELVEVIKSSLPSSALREKQHPAKRTFQAIRIAVNDELYSVSEMMKQVPECLNIGGRVCVISFHSLEDRIVKNAIASFENGCTCPKEFPVCICGFKQTMKAVTRKPIIPGEKELLDNPRARSAKLRIAQRV